jgi:hypothetical protein
VRQKQIVFLLIVTSIVATALACRPVEKTGEKYYDLDSLFQAQSQLLISEKARLRKSATLDKKKDTASFAPDSLGWINEFGTLSTLALINKPIYLGLYTIENEQDSKSNLHVLSYSVKEGKKVPVPFVKIYYLGSLNNIKRIEGVYNEENELFTGSQTLSIELQDVYNKTVMTSYIISGHQKMILADSVDFEIEGRISIN